MVFARWSTGRLCWSSGVNLCPMLFLAQSCRFWETNHYKPWLLTLIHYSHRNQKPCQWNDRYRTNWLTLVSRDSAVGEWESHCLSYLWPGFNSHPWRSVSRGFHWLITLSQPVLSQRGRKWLNLPLMTPHNLWTVRRKAEVQLRTDNGWKN